MKYEPYNDPMLLTANTRAASNAFSDLVRRSREADGHDDDALKNDRPLHDFMQGAAKSGRGQMALKVKRYRKSEAETHTVGKTDIKRSALEAWRKLDEVIQNELASIQKGEKELNASTATAIVKYIEASVSLASGSEDLSEKDVQDRSRAMMAKLTLPTFDEKTLSSHPRD